MSAFHSFPELRSPVYVSGLERQRGVALLRSSHPLLGIGYRAGGLDSVMSADVIRPAHQTVPLPTQRQWTALIPGGNALRSDGLRDLSRELSHRGRADIELAALRPSSHICASVAKG